MKIVHKILREDITIIATHLIEIPKFISRIIARITAAAAMLFDFGQICL
jgi:hypothetical protein